MKQRSVSDLKTPMSKENELWSPCEENEAHEPHDSLVIVNAKSETDREQTTQTATSQVQLLKTGSLSEENAKS